MKPALVILASVAVLVAAESARSHPAGPPASSSGEIVFYGHVKTLVRKGSRYELRFDPAWWLTGYAAQKAKLADTGSSDVPNDYYVVEEGHRLLTFLVFPRARVTVLTGGTHATPVAVSELAQIVKGKNPKHRRLSEPKAGFWIRIGPKYPNPVVSLEQQYQP